MPVFETCPGVVTVVRRSGPMGSSFVVEASEAAVEAMLGWEAEVEWRVFPLGLAMPVAEGASW